MEPHFVQLSTVTARVWVRQYVASGRQHFTTLPHPLSHTRLLPPLPIALEVIILAPHLGGSLMEESKQSCKLNYTLRLPFTDRVPLCSLPWPWTHDLSALASWMLGVSPWEVAAGLYPSIKEGEIDSWGNRKPRDFGRDVRNEISTTIRGWQSSLPLKVD